MLATTCAACGSDDDSADTSSATSAAATSASATASAAAAAAVLTATNAFLATLSTAQKTSVQGERTAANLAQWSNLPDQLFKRAGLRMDALSAAQQAAALKVLRAALSDEGYTQVTGITTADGVLKDSGGMDLDFGADHYWIRILGTPSASGKWTVQYGGHHLAVNVTMAGSEMTLAPTLWGAQPASYTKSGATTEPLSGETTKAFAVVGALDATQLKSAVLTTSITEIVLGAGQDGKTLATTGVKASTFTDAQKTLLLALIDEWLTPLNDEQAAAKVAEAKANIDQTTFSWYGKTTIGNPIYYRVQGPTFTIEFAHQQGQGANAGGVTHIHSIYREPDNDYGAELS
ncbi:DUF3500 domain-containing protein [Cryptosporangium aurantiacum]|uniref:DUF3500 domain-containing protein n=1 Tax=Cryptosporangium aurantiacum TaxID=134849 RepID=A0A1M7QS98_9ACTN|nr:DUF3500 domain-containing protein [Cryptosporangium aurantiacum]SHN34550.1 Protein of unknown function [Cryptosporangium aurantiacum]